MKSTAEDLVMVYLQAEANIRRDVTAAATLFSFHLQTDGDEEEAPVGEADVQRCS